VPTSLVLVRKDSYQDSVLLMRISREVTSLPGVLDAVVAMGTPHNRELLQSTGYVSAALRDAGPNDLVIAVRSEDVGQATIEQAVDRLLRGKATATTEQRPTTLAGAVTDHPDANLVLISLPGEHAVREARRALSLGRHVMLFSDNVSVEDEVSLKREAAKKGLLMMGPDCGTAIINGMPLAFANVVRRGPIGIVGAAGTGIQEISSCIDRMGGGVSQAIGTGGRDLSEAVGGTMMLLGIEALAADRATKVLVIVSKPPSEAVAERVIAAAKGTGKPTVIHFVGGVTPPRGPSGAVQFADTLASTAEVACRLAGVAVAQVSDHAVSEARVAELLAHMEGRSKLRGLFCGGTTGNEALVLLSRAGLEVRSNLHKKGPLKVDGATVVSGHVLLDLGDDLFCVGRPHPMIEPGLRNERLLLEMQDPEVGVLLFDVVLGHGSHADPAGLLVEGVGAARQRRPHLVAVASVTGTEADPQCLSAQRRALEAAGVVVMPDNRRAAELAALLIKRVQA
jgi:succinyl-CoA synthetase alpha subunit